ncbi:MAG: hypothetical protein ACI8UZ_001827 [Akkermansiaceae bacterium]|jgi:hypothetical protein
MIELKTSFSRRELLWFGPLFALFGAMVGGMALWKFEAPTFAKWIWIVSAVVILLYSLLPPLRKWIFIAWMAAVFPIGWIVSHVLLAAVFYLVVFPIGLLMRCFRYDALGRSFDRDCKSYWKKREANDDSRRYFRQF